MIENTGAYVKNMVNNIKETIKPMSKSDMKCAPGMVYDAGSCAELSVLIELAKAYNKTNNTEQIKLAPNFETLNPKKYKAYLVIELNRRIGDKCTTQKCWSKQDFVKHMEEVARDKFMKHTFRPDSPQGKFEWLSTIDINDSMEQYVRKYKGFKFFGAVPMDFAKLHGLEIADVDYNSLSNKGITKMGVIFNLDNHDQPGSHWTAMYTDFNKGHIFYFDSVGTEPEPRVRELMRKQARYMETIGKDVNSIRTDYNKIQHQRGGSECGVYSMNFLIRMTRGDDFDKLCARVISDEKINKCRNVYFDKHVHKKKG